MANFEVVFIQYFVDSPGSGGLPAFDTDWREFLVLIPLAELRRMSWQKQRDMLGVQIPSVHWDIGVISVNDGILERLNDGLLRVRGGASQYLLYEPSTGRSWGYDSEKKRWVEQPNTSSNAAPDSLFDGNDESAAH